MKTIDAAVIVRLVGKYRAIEETLRDHKDANTEVSQKDKKTAIQDLTSMGNELEALSLEMSMVSLKRLKASLTKKIDITYAKVVAMFSDVNTRIVDELRTKRLIALESKQADQLFQDQPYFGSNVQLSFPSASYEIDEAGKCQALGRHNATMFHLMRILEIQIRSVLLCLALPPYSPGPSQTWGALLSSIKAEIERRRRSSWATIGDKALFDEIYGSLDAVRAAWRNPTMHVERVYTSDEVAVVFDVVKMLSQQIAARMDEGGQPLA